MLNEGQYVRGTPSTLSKQSGSENLRCNLVRPNVHKLFTIYISGTTTSTTPKVYKGRQYNNVKYVPITLGTA